MELVYLLLLWEILLLIIVIITTSFDYTCPSFLTLVMFMLSTISLAFNQWKWNVEFRFTTFLILSCGLATVVIVDIIICEHYRKVRLLREDGGFEIVKNEKPYVSGGEMKLIILGSSLLMMFLYLQEIHSIGNAFNIRSLISSIGAVQQERHTGVIATICLRLGYALSNLYAFMFCHNVIVSREKIMKNWYLLVSMFSGIISTFFSGSRSLLLGVLFAFLFYLIIFSRIRSGWREIKLKKYLKYIIPSAFLFILIFYLSRNVIKNRQYSVSIFDYITYYLGNSQQLLNVATDNLQTAFPIKNGMPGLYTFQFLYNELAGYGIISLPSRVSSHFLPLGGSGILSRGNVYTLFGEPYNDFGFLGMIIYVAVFYSIFCHFYYKYIRNWKNKEKNRKVLLIFGSMYYYVALSFYLAPTVWLKIQTIVTLIIVIFVYKAITRYKVVIR